MTLYEKRSEALDLRRTGMSIRAIKEKLGVSKGAVSLWCRDITLTPEQQQKLHTSASAARSRGRLIGARMNHEAKLRKMNKYARLGKITTSKLGGREILLIGAAIYWGEGSKVGQLSFINSDKDMVLFMYRWFRVALGVTEQDFMPRIYINHSHKSRKKTIEAYWSKLLNVPLEQFRNTVFIKRESKKRHENHDEYFGLLSLRIRKSTDLKYRILGLIEGLKCSTFR